MAGTDNSAFLAEAARRRHQQALDAAREAIERLDREKQPVNFCAVADAAGVSRAWLYRQPQIRALITTLRSTTPSTTSSAQRASAESLRQRLDAARDEITRLRADNTSLRDQLARHLGAQRARQAAPQPINHR
jgi:uncharacterized protein DUF6262